MRSILMIAGVAALAVAQSPATKTTPSELASSRWFVDATEVNVDPEAATDEASELGLCIAFDANGKAQVELGDAKFAAAPFTHKAENGQVQFATLVADQKHGQLQWNATVKKAAMSGKIVWHCTDGKERSYEISGRKATEFEDTKWKLTVTPEKVDEDDEVDPPFAEILEIRRGLLQIVDTDESQLYAEPSAFAVVKFGGRSTLTTRTGVPKDGELWRLEIDGKTLAGSLTERSDGELITRFSIRGVRIEKAAPRR